VAKHRHIVEREARKAWPDCDRRSPEIRVFALPGGSVSIREAGIMKDKTSVMDRNSARVVTLRRYIALLRQEESRLSWILGSPRASEQTRVEASAALQLAVEKLSKADRELQALENRLPY